MTLDLQSGNERSRARGQQRRARSLAADSIGGRAGSSTQGGAEGAGRRPRAPPVAPVTPVTPVAPIVPVVPVVAINPDRPIDRLFHRLVSEGASDLHMSSDEIPIIRKDGDMVRLTGESALSAEELFALLLPIVPRTTAPSSRRKTTPTSPTRSRGSRASASTCSAIATASAPCSADPGQDHLGARSSGCRRRSSTCAACTRASCSSPGRPARASRPRSRR